MFCPHCGEQVVTSLESVEFYGAKVSTDEDDPDSEFDHDNAAAEPVEFCINCATEFVILWRPGSVNKLTENEHE